MISAPLSYSALRYGRFLNRCLAVHGVAAGLPIGQAAGIMPHVLESDFDQLLIGERAGDAWAAGTVDNDLIIRAQQIRPRLDQGQEDIDGSGKGLWFRLGQELGLAGGQIKRTTTVMTVL